MKMKDGKITALMAISLINTYRLNGDFCTNFPDKIGHHSLKLACKLHDIQYTKYALLKKGDKAMLNSAKRRHVLAKKAGDLFLYDDITRDSHRGIGALMWLGVFLFGGKYWRK